MIYKVKTNIPIFKSKFWEKFEMFPNDCTSLCKRSCFTFYWFIYQGRCFLPSENRTKVFNLQPVTWGSDRQITNSFTILCITASVDSSTWVCLFYCSPLEWLSLESSTQRLYHDLKHICLYERVFMRLATRWPAELVWKAARQLTSLSNFQKYDLDYKKIFYLLN